MNEWTKAGTITVDSGCVAVGDPCYTMNKEANDVADTWTDWLAETYPRVFGAEVLRDHNPTDSDLGKPTNVRGLEGAGVVVGTLYGDGSYPVYVKKNAAGRVTALMVDFKEAE